jgi:hypothetical protein
MEGENKIYPLPPAPSPNLSIEEAVEYLFGEGVKD